eukprot:15365327-Ditylum_brightwellii.AAC.3
MGVHQCARFSNQPMLSHERALHQIIKYLNTTPDREIVYEPDPNLGIQCSVDADFAGSWSKADADNPESAMSRTSFVIMYAGCPVLWQSKLKTEIALSTVEAEYIALSSAMREVIPFMSLLEELSKIFDLHMSKPEILCKVFEDNKSCIAIAKMYKFSPRTKHIALKYHHFKMFVTDGKLVILPISTKE